MSYRPNCVCKHKYVQHNPACATCDCTGYREKPRRTRGSGSIFKRADGYWIGRVELSSTDGKRRHKTVSSRDPNVCIRRLKQLNFDVAQGKIAATSNATVGAWLDKWLNEIHGRKLRPSTLDSYESVIRLHIKPQIGSKRLSNLTPEHVRQMHRSITHSRTAQIAHVVLQRALKDAVREGILARNVAEVAEKPQHTTKQREPLSAEQVKQLLRSAIDSNDPLATRWAAAFLLGARKGELLGLQWSRCDLVNGVVDFSWQLQELTQQHGCGEHPCGKPPGWCPQRQWNLKGLPHIVLHRSLVLTPPKTKAGARWVPIPLPLWYMLEAHPRGQNNPHDLVWHHDDGRPIGPRKDHEMWCAALETAGLPYAPPHAARHTTATLLAESGVPEQVSMAILGHASISAHRGYVHDPALAMAREGMSTALDRLLS